MTKEGQDIDKRFLEIEKRVEMLEENQEEQLKTMHAVNEKVDKIDGRINDEFKTMVKSTENMRELIQQQSAQNNDILHKVLDGNQKADERAVEREQRKYEQKVQLVTSLLTTGGVVYLLVQHLLGG